MRGAALLVCAITAVLGKDIRLNSNGCPIDYTVEKLIPHANCNRYYQCFHGTLVERKCSDGLLFNEKKNICDWPKNVECNNQIKVKNNYDNGKTNNKNNSGREKCNCNPKEASQICSKPGSDDELIAHEHCNKFYKCTHGKNVSMRCPKTLLYNPYREWCDYPENVHCGVRVIPDPEEDEKETEQEDNNNNGGGDHDNGNNNNGPCNCVPDEAPSLCAKSDSDGVLVAHEHCNKFYKCSHGKNVSMRCPGTLLYNPYREWCDFPENVKCGDRVIPDPEDDEKETEHEDNNNNGESDNNNGNNNNGTCNCVPGEAPSLCAKSDSDGVLVAHEHCNKFYKCTHGKNVSMRCPKALLYNPYREWCDYPENVKCGDRVIPDPEEDEKETEQEDNNNGGGDNDNGNNNNGPCNCVPGEAPTLCAKSDSDGVLVAHEHCNKFYKCTHGKNVSMRCPGTLLYNPYREWCDFPENVKCGERIIPDPEEDEKETEQEDNNNNNGGGDNGNHNNGTCNCVPGEAPSLCAKSDSDGVLVAHEHCNKFYKCTHGKNVSMRCPKTLLYNPYREWCDYPENVHCGDRVIPDPEEDEKETEQEDNNNNNGGGDNGNHNNGTCNCVPGEAPSLCAKSDSDGVLVAHEHCNKFYKCTHGKNVSMRCPKTLLYNPYREWCDYPENVHCGDRVIPDPEEDEKETEQEDNNNNGGGDHDNGNNNNGPCNCVPDEAPSLCAKSDSDGVLVAHEHCNKFYKCSHGKNVSMRCPGTLLYNPYREWCDYPENVKCGDRVIPDPEEDEKETEQEDNNNNGGGDNDNGNNNNGPCNCVPGEAPSLCAKSDSDGVLVAHEHCNKFYKCTHGKNVSMRCPGTLLYNPYREWCDFPENVKCGERIIPDPEEDEKETEQEDNNNNNGGGDNGNHNNGTCNCVPGEAPTLCAKSDSDGVLVAHEHCNKFYKCTHGKNVSMRCPGTLLYNPYREWCDFPENVKCGERIIPDPEEDEKETEQEDNNNNNGGGDNGNHNNGTCNCVPGEASSLCAKSDSDGVLVAHEHCNKFYKCTHGKNVSMKCPKTLLYNPYREWCDYPENVKCGDRVIPDPEEDEKETEQEDNNNGGGDNGNNNSGPCNCVPGEAPALCAKSNSDGVLVAHEHCNKFYKCTHGKNVSMRCPKTLLYNPYREWCDFPDNVKCGDRVIPDPEEDEKEMEQEYNNNNNDNGGGDNEKGKDNNGTCNCVPGEAPFLCAKSDSDGVLVAHEHCNKFYKCTHGKNVSMKCPKTLLYNPYREWCDYPENVKCGDRLIPDPEEDEKETEQEDNNNNNGGGDHDNGNNNNGPCNCVPDEAPSLCAKSNSDGVLVAHEHCNKFYKCTHGKNVSMRCPKTLFYNPYREWCDYPENVKCGDRIIPDPEEDEKEYEQENNNNNGVGDNGNHNNGTCNCVPGEAPSLCAKSDSEGVLVAHEHCNKFYQCTHGKNVSMRCPKSLLYNPYREWCDFPENVKCGDRIIPDPEEDETETEQEDNNNNGGGDNDNGNNNNGPCNCVPGEAPSLCAKSNSDGVLVAHEHCNKFYKCTHGKNVSMRCPKTLLYNPYREWCDYPENVKCGDRIIPDPEEDEKEYEQENNNNNGGGDNGNHNNGTCNCVPGEAPSLCAKSDSDGVLVAHEHCNKFYKCTHGKNVSMRCPKTLLYNPYREWCDYPENVKCGDRVIPDPEEDEKETEQEDNNNGGGDNGNNNNGPCNCVPGEAPALCAKSDSDGVLVAHEHCNKFYQCTHGKNVSMRCPKTLLYNPYREWCDFPENVKCGDRIIPDPEEDEKEYEQENNNNNNNGVGDNGNHTNGTCNCVPGEAPSLCAKSDSDGVLVAHEHCNKFYKCTHGKNVSMRCPKTLFYNPYREWCDYPENVKCGDRLIPDPEEDEKETEQEDNNNNNGGGDHDNGNNNNGPCNCVPDEAPSLCAKSNSDGVLVAHEHCNKFYKCTHGKNVSMRCPKTLFYNPYREWCDYPENVKCGDRIIPDPEEDEKEYEQENNNNNGVGDNGNHNNGTCNCVPGEAPSLCAKSDSEGVLVAHEHCNKFYQCTHGKNVSMRCPKSLLYNPYREWCDFPENVKCGDRIIPDPEEDETETEQEDNNNNGGGDNDNGNNNNGPCNCVPGEAPSLCAKSNSDGVLVAHEHCNKFYKCTHGKNVSMRCPKTLLYNPYREWCDYPENVKCGDRIIPDPEEDEKEYEQENNNNNGGGDNGNHNNGTCNCVPGEAPSLCAKSDSDGVLVAHEHCNKFYKCTHGKNVSMRCPKTLLYNPYREWCDYPENVKCGDRVIPDPEEDEKETEQEDNNNGGGDNGNNNNGPCNCVPGEAPALCAKSDSDGVLVAHEHCNKFYQCTHGKNVSMRCPKTLLYNPYREWCDFPENVKCGDRIIPDPEEDEKEYEQENNNNNNNGVGDNGNHTNGTCNCVPGEAPSLCAKSDSDGVLVAHEHCNKFYQCTHGKNVSMRCPKTLLYNPYREWCDFPENVKCGDRIIPDPEEDEKEYEQENNNNNGGGDNGNHNNGTCNCVPGEAPSLCAESDSDGVLVAHEHCNKFYKCTHGKNVSMRCPKTLLYNPYREWCDYPENVKCGDRIIPDPEEDEKEYEQENNNNNNNGVGDNGNHTNGTCNCVPGEAPSLCAKSDSDGVLVAHEHCNKFYKCTHGKNVSMRCPKTLLYNPYREWCDYPENVKCGNRIIPDPEEDEMETEKEDYNNNNNGGGDNDNNINNNNGPCNCVPGEAPTICAKSGMDGVLVAHEHCNKFYQCTHGKNVSMRCPKTLLYNPYREWCDFPENVKCGDRVIPDPDEDDKDTEPENNNNNGGGDNDNGNNNNGPCNCVPGEAPIICGKSESDGILIAHEHCNKFYQCSHGKNISMRCPQTLLYNPFREFCDFPQNVKCGDRIIPDPDDDVDMETGQEDNDDNNGSINCNPAEAPGVCAKDGSDGVLVAHEHCNMFYKCSHGKNIEMICPENLLYNPSKEWCDFPANVQCGDRIVQNNDNGSCNCSRAHALVTCENIGMNGITIAHEKCNHFYVCSHGNPVEFTCPQNLLFNTKTQVCDWPNVVDCGERITNTVAA